MSSGGLGDYSGRDDVLNGWDPGPWPDSDDGCVTAEDVADEQQNQEGR